MPIGNSTYIQTIYDNSKLLKITAHKSKKVPKL